MAAQGLTPNTTTQAAAVDILVCGLRAHRYGVARSQVHQAAQLATGFARYMVVSVA